MSSMGDLRIGVLPLPGRPLLPAPGNAPRLVMTRATSIDGVVEGLALGPQAADVRQALQRALGAANEVIFRAELRASIEELSPNQRRTVLARGVQLFRSQRPAPVAARAVRPTLLAKAQGVEEAVRGLLEESGDYGLPTKELADAIQQFGAVAVSTTLKKIGVKVENDRVFVLHKAEPEVLPKGAHSAGGADDPRSDPVGARKVWNKRIVEKKEDGKWHVVGHIAGLEDPAAVQPLDVSMLSREHLLHLLQTMLKLREVEKKSAPKKSAATPKAPSAREEPPSNAKEEL